MVRKSIICCDDLNYSNTLMARQFITNLFVSLYCVVGFLQKKLHLPIYSNSVALKWHVRLFINTFCFIYLDYQRRFKPTKYVDQTLSHIVEFNIFDYLNTAIKYVALSWMALMKFHLTKNFIQHRAKFDSRDDENTTSFLAQLSRPQFVSSVSTLVPSNKTGGKFWREFMGMRRTAFRFVQTLLYPTQFSTVHKPPNIIKRFCLDNVILTYFLSLNRPLTIGIFDDGQSLLLLAAPICHKYYQITDSLPMRNLSYSRFD